MAISGLEYGAPATAVGAAGAALGELDEVLWAAKSPEELLDVVAELERLRSRLAAVELAVANEIECSDAAKTVAQWQSAGDYLTATAGGRRGHGRRMLRTGRALCSERAETMRSLREGRISPEHADVIVVVLNHLPTDAELRDTAEQVLLREAVNLNATELRIAGEKLLELLDPDGHKRREEKKLAREERSAHLNRFLVIAEDGLGGVRVTGRGTVEDAAVVRAALQSLAAPTAEQLTDTDSEHGVAGRDVRDHGARFWDALVDTCQKSLDAEVLPTSHGRRPRVTVTIDLDSLRSELGVGTLDTGQTLSATAVRRLACHAEILPVVLDGAGAVLDVGRAQRLAAGAVWDAVVARDKHCRFPGCRRPPIACDAHHIVHWVDGGDTAVSNLVLLCGAHHTIIHSTGWQVRISPADGHPEFKPPPVGRQPRSPMTEQVDEDDGWIRERATRG